MSEDTWAVSRLGAPFSPINFPLDMGLGERNGISPEPPTPSFVQRFHCALARNPGRMRPGLHDLTPALLTDPGDLQLRARQGAVLEVVLENPSGQGGA